ncbi:sulfur oxidation c-type cytochrome SoxX [Roseateles saccharophilus]|uniref:Monoheme cytochrome SoxX (Sulfur oxidation) n=1 Tax=Roseateles saccharophilus TaxID=304 RepID=A0A4R3VIB1_ROSSA|nr:sulfur oxidation c-type cytochrome SoxX [Roseateles saccharophilus]MDG0832081.1 sulfur oxidation c-type cytochrome SoxX [Roseateles saccharophilus]TCV03489.1 monoheme cytochrome SoxX (sulfur oxidation) [Roseateles saccharophilus]
MKIAHFAALALLAAGAAQAQRPADRQVDLQTAVMMRASFRDQGIAKVERLNQDAAQRACSQPEPPPAAVAKKIQAREAAAIKWPADGQFIGDWKEGEKLAQNGRGMTWSDASAATAKNGGSCYNCHQIDRKEISFGTIGPSLWNYGKLRGVADPASPAAADIVRYTWGKLWNSKAYAACSNMPRFGHAELLDERQLRDVMALLLDPKSPVNQ